MKQNRAIDPLQAMHKVWKATDFEFVLNELKYCFYMALSEENSAYEEADDRRKFIEFYDKFLTLIKATSETNMPAIGKFYTQYSLIFVRSELWKFFKSVWIYEGPLKLNIDRINIYSLYESLLCIAEAAYVVVSSTRG
jgi:hypothetical protein